MMKKLKLLVRKKLRKNKIFKKVAKMNIKKRKERKFSTLILMMKKLKLLVRKKLRKYKMCKRVAQMKMKRPKATNRRRKLRQSWIGMIINHKQKEKAQKSRFKDIKD